MFAFFFLIIKILGPFVPMTRKGDAAFARRLAIRAFFVSCLALVFAAMVRGERDGAISDFDPRTGDCGGQFDTAESGPPEYEPSLKLAVSPLAFPTIVTPHGIAAVIICMALTPDFLTRGAIFGALLGLMVLNLVAMLFARPALRYAGMPMQIVGIVLGIIQVALIVTGLRGLGVLPRS